MGTLSLISKKEVIQRNPDHVHHLKASDYSPGFPLDTAKGDSRGQRSEL